MDEKSMETIGRFPIVHNNAMEQVIQITMVKNSNKFHGIFFDMTIKNGVIIRQIANHSEAQKSNLRQGDRILEICGLNMRMANYRIAEKILNECNDNEIIMKINRIDDESILPELGKNRKLIRKQNTLVRRNAFKCKNRILYRYFERKQKNEMYRDDNYFLNIILPR
ncbi:hypothetical protein BLA29_011942, partial [Euroglyphus maynei]